MISAIGVCAENIIEEASRIKVLRNTIRMLADFLIVSTDILIV